MFIIDILIYVFFAFFSSSLAKKSENYIGENDLSSDKWDKYLIWFVVFFTIIGGIRWNVGSDSISYAAIFNHADLDFEENREILWKLLVYSFQSLNLHWTFGLAFCAFIQIYFITKTTMPYRCLLVFLPFVLFGGRYWIDCMGAVRQMIVACGFLWASRFIYEKKLLKYILFIAVGAMVHQSAVILLPFYFMPNNLMVTDKRLLLIGIFLACVVIGQAPAFQGIADYVQIIAGASNYDAKIDSLTELLTSGETDESLSFGPMMLSYLLIPICIIWYGSELEEEYCEKIPYFNLWFNFAYLYACGYFLVCNIGHYFIRPVMYFCLFQMVIAAGLLRFLWCDYVNIGRRQIATLFFCVTIAVNTGWDIYKASGKTFESSTYKIFLFHKYQRKWFNL